MGSEDPERAPERAERKRKERSASAEAGRERKRDKKDKKERRSKDKKEKKDRRDKAQKQHEGRDGHDEDDAKAAAELKAKLMMPVEDGEIDAEDGEIAEAGSAGNHHGFSAEQRDRELGERRRSSRSRSRSTSRERRREKERDRERERERDRERRERERERERRDRDRDRDRDRRERDSDPRERYTDRQRLGRRDEGRDREVVPRDNDRVVGSGSRREEGGRSNGESKEPEAEVDEEELLEKMASAQTAEEEEAKLIEERRVKRAAILAKHKAVESKNTAAVVSPAATQEEEEEEEAAEDMNTDFTAQLQKDAGKADDAALSSAGGEMFADDMFDENSPVAKAAAASGKGFADNWDDADGYYRARVGEMLMERFEVTGEVGRGVFSTVLLATDTQSQKEVAIKVIRANDLMYKTAQIETVILKKLAGADPENKRHCIKMLSQFEFREHVFMVFEPMAMNLREVLKKYGRNVGLSILAVQKFAKQMLISLKHLKNCGVLHADIKLDNILVNDKHNLIKVCDFGSAMFAGQNEITPYLVSRFYRPPEVVLGLEYSFPMDLWAIGCCLFELFTGKIAFPGKSNNEMVKLFMDMMGPFPKKMLKKALFSDKHFDDDYNLSLMEEDPVTKALIRRIISNPKPGKDMSQVLNAKNKSLTDAERTKVLQLADLLSKMFDLDPEKRIKVGEALQHPFVKTLESRF